MEDMRIVLLEELATHYTVVEPPKVSNKYPSREETKQENVNIDLNNKREITKKFYEQIVSELPRMSPRRKKHWIEKINALRPPLNIIAREYLNKGESKETVRKLVTFENYPFLPAVKITKKQQEKLTEACNGIIDQSFIANGYF